MDASVGDVAKKVDRDKLKAQEGRAHVWPL